MPKSPSGGYSRDAYIALAASAWRRWQQNRRVVWVGYAVIAVVLVAAPFFTDVALGHSWVRVLDFVLLYMLLALGLNIVVGYAGLLDLGYIAFYAVGAYLYALLSSPQLANIPAIAAHFPAGLHLPFWAVLPIGAAVAGLFGVLLGAPTLRLRGDYLAIVTLGFGEIIRIFMNNLNAPVNLTNGPQGINHIDPVSVGGVGLDRATPLFGMMLGSVQKYYFLFLAFVLLALFISIRLQDSRIGRAWAAIREDEVAAAATGINTRNLKLLAFAMGATFGGVAGGLFASFQGFISPESFNLLESIMILCMIVLGGMGNVAGVVLGAFLLTVLPEALRWTGELQRAVLGRVVVDPSDLRMLVFGFALILMMQFRPAGLLPSTRRKREFEAEDGVLAQEQETVYDARR